MSIETFLDRNGKGILTEELRRIFVANGCEPSCHICNKGIAVGDKLHLKPFFTRTSDQALLSSEAADVVDRAGLDDETDVPQVDQRGKTTSSIDVMICWPCSKANRRLPRGEANKLLATAFIHGMVKEVSKAPATASGIAPERRSYSGRFPFRGGGCMIVRKAGEAAKIVAGESK